MSSTVLVFESHSETIKFFFLSSQTDLIEKCREDMENQDKEFLWSEEQSGITKLVFRK
jgi:hypothetical protein